MHACCTLLGSHCYRAVFILSYSLVAQSNHLVVCLIQGRAILYLAVVSFNRNTIKTFDCKKCYGHHATPINFKCQNVSKNSSGTIDRPKGLSSYISVRILQELQSLSGHVTKIEDKVNHQGQAAATVASPTRSQASSRSSELHSDLMILPMDTLKRSCTIQGEVDNRLRELKSFTDKNKFKSQRGGGGGLRLCG